MINGQGVFTNKLSAHIDFANAVKQLGKKTLPETQTLDRHSKLSGISKAQKLNQAKGKLPYPNNIKSMTEQTNATLVKSLGIAATDKVGKDNFKPYYSAFGTIYGLRK